VHEIVLNAEVRTGPIGGGSDTLGTITTCDPHPVEILITNPYPVEVYIDSVKFLAGSGGFSISKSILPTISIPGDSTYSAPLLIYSFPPDSLNGTQQLELVAFQRSGEGEHPILDTFTVSLERKQQVFALHAVAPAFVASADDVSPLRLPITVTGPREGVTELDSWTLSLQFSNDLFEPIGVDTTGSVTVPLYPSIVSGDSSYSLSPYWDQPTRTYTIIVAGSAVSDPAKVKNDLLLTLLLRAYLTTDTVVTVTPTFTWSQRPCAYNLQTFTLDVPYADDCGDQTIRDAMLGESQAINIISVWPNPADGASDVSVAYNAKEAMAITCIVFDETGQEIGRFNESLPTGNGTFAIPAGLLPKSGPAFVRIEGVLPEQAGSFIPAQSFKIEVVK
jgi:hypothetical protein